MKQRNQADSNHYDFLVIGGGSGGVRAARWAAQLGARVALAEADRMGGTCVIRGCVPKKLMVMSAHYGEEAPVAASFGWARGPGDFDFSQLKKNRDAEVARLEKIYQNLMSKNGVELYPHRATLLGPHSAKVGDQTLRADHILLATGGRPYRPHIEGQQYLSTSDDVFELQQLPSRVLIIGGGYIALEFAGIFHALGSSVTVIIRGQRVLNGFDRETAKFLQGQLVQKGLKILTEDQVEKVEKDRQHLIATTSKGKVLECDFLLSATGRRPNTQNLGAEEVGLKLTKEGRVEINSRYQSSVKSIYAVGDCANRVNLTPVALREGMCVAEDLFAKKQSGFIPREVDYQRIPSAIFSSPPLASIGPSEEQAIDQYGQEAIEVYTSSFRPMQYSLSDYPEKTFFKLIVEKSSRRVLAAHLCGLAVPEMIQGLAVAIRAGATKEIFDSTVGVHPTSAEEFVTLRSARPARTDL